MNHGILYTSLHARKSNDLGHWWLAPHSPPATATVVLLGQAAEQSIGRLDDNIIMASGLKWDVITSI
jgi:hypothetical protein